MKKYDPELAKGRGQIVILLPFTLQAANRGLIVQRKKSKRRPLNKKTANCFGVSDILFNFAAIKLQNDGDTAFACRKVLNITHPEYEKQNI